MNMFTIKSDDFEELAYDYANSVFFIKMAEQKQKESGFGKAMIGGVVGDIVIGTPITVAATKLWDKKLSAPFKKRIGDPVSSKVSGIWEKVAPILKKSIGKIPKR